jgi:hypothetical protein
MAIDGFVLDIPAVYPTAPDALAGGARIAAVAERQDLIEWRPLGQDRGITPLNR